MAAPVVPWLLAAGALFLGLSGKKKRAAADEPPATRGAGLPWNVEDERTRIYQRRVNTRLLAAGYMPIEDDGILGKETCAAGRFVAVEFGRPELAPDAVGADCREFGAPPAKQAGLLAEECSLVQIQALSTGDPVVMVAAADRLDRVGSDACSSLADSLRGIAESIEQERGGRTGKTTKKTGMV